MMTKNLITTNNIILHARFFDKWEAIKACGDILFQQGYVRKEYINDMIEREELASVYIGNHVAIPHGIANSEKNILKSGIAFIQIPDGVDFDGEKAYIMIGIAGKDGTHIDILSNIATVCMDTENIEILRTTEDKEQVLRLFTQQV
jgi:PTS system mannitol-specific IIA component